MTDLRWSAGLCAAVLFGVAWSATDVEMVVFYTVVLWIALAAALAMRNRFGWSLAVLMAVVAIAVGFALTNGAAVDVSDGWTNVAMNEFVVVAVAWTVLGLKRWLAPTPRDPDDSRRMYQ